MSALSMRRRCTSCRQVWGNSAFRVQRGYGNTCKWCRSWANSLADVDRLLRMARERAERTNATIARLTTERRALLARMREDGRTIPENTTYQGAA